MDLWEWITTTTSFDNVITALGLGVLAFLFARDLILTRGAHLRRVADLTTNHEKLLAEKDANHARELAEKDSRLATVDESRREWKEATRLATEQRDKATASLGEMAGAHAGILHVLESLDQAVKEANRDTP